MAFSKRKKGRVRNS